MIEQDISGETPAPEAEVEAQAPEQTQEAPPAESAPQAEEQKATKPDVAPVQKRIDQLTWRAHETERRLNAELMRRQEVEDENRKLREQQRELMRLATMPTMEQANLDPNAYEKMLREHNEKFLQEQRKEAEEGERRRIHMEATARFQSNLQARVAEAQQKYPDYQEVIGNPTLPPLQSVNPYLFAAIVEHEDMADITYYLGKNPAEAHRIAALPPAKAILEVGKIAAKLPTQSSKTSAPPPPNQVSGNTATVQKDPSQMSYDEFVKWRRKQIAARR